MSMYRVARSTSINGVDVPYYKCLRGSNSLEGFHKVLPHMIPGTRCRTYATSFHIFSPYLYIMLTTSQSSGMRFFFTLTVYRIKL